MPFVDPYTRFHKAIVAALQSYQCITTVFRAQNILDLTLQQWADFESIALKAPTVGQFPQLIVLSDGSDSGLNPWTSQCDAETKDYRIIVGQDCGLNAAVINEYEYRVKVALRAYQETYRAFGCQDIVKKVRMRSCARGGMQGEGWARNSRRWFATVRITAEFYSPRGENAVALANGYPPPSTVLT